MTALTGNQAEKVCNGSAFFRWVCRDFYPLKFYERISGMRSLLLLALTFFLPTISFSQDVSPKLLRMPEYIISPEASSVGIDGKLGILVWVKKDGTVERAEAYSGPMWPCGSEPKSELAAVRSGAEDVVKKAMFSPALKDGQPEDREILLTMLVGKAYENKKKYAAENKASGSAQPDAKPSVIPGGVINGKAISLPKPDYPYDLMNRSRPEGAVHVDVLINESGDVISAGAVDGDPLLQEVSRKAACKAKFSPTQLSGVPVKVSGIVTYNFVR